MTDRPTRLSAVVTTLDNVGTIGKCLRSAGFADEILVVDSGSTDGTVEEAAKLGARVITEAFRGYGPQKSFAVSQAAHDWVLLLDADEELSRELASEIENLLQNRLDSDGYRLRREEWLYWQWPRTGTRLTDHLRLFDRRRMTMGDHPVHAAPQVAGVVGKLNGRLRHHGQHGLHAQVDRVNAYTTDAADWNRHNKSRPGLRMLLAPPIAFLREYLARRQFLNGWAGFIAARTSAFHAFLRHAKALEAKRNTSGRGD